MLKLLHPVVTENYICTEARRTRGGHQVVACVRDDREVDVPVWKVESELPDVVVVMRGAVAHGGWLIFRRGDDEDRCSGGLVRGHRADPSNLCDWAREAYEALS